MVKEFNLEDGGYLRIEIIDDEEIALEVAIIQLPVETKLTPKNPIETELDNLAEDMKKLDLLMGNLIKQ